MRFWDAAVLSFCRLGVAGLDPKAPGTWGTAMACLLAPYVFCRWALAGARFCCWRSFFWAGWPPPEQKKSWNAATPAKWSLTSW
jgi:hypothetical protein